MRTTESYRESREIIASKAFGPYSMAEAYRDLSARLGHDFSASIALLERLPPFMAGDDHKRIRRAMALQNEVSKPGQLEAVRAFLAAFAQEALQPGITLDLVTGFSRPLYRAIVAATPVLPDPADNAQHLVERFPTLFSSTTPLKHRIETNRLLETVLEQSGEGVLDDLSLLILGSAPLVGSLALTIHDVFSKQQGVRLREVTWPGFFTQSAVRYVDRVCNADTHVAGARFQPGERVQCPIRSDEWSESENRALTFGAGAHLCLGRGLSEEVWAMVVEILGASDLRADCAPLVMRLQSEPFAMPETAQVTFLA